MPYAKNADLPEGVKGLPAAGQSMWRRVFNNSHGKYGEEKAFAIAWGAVKRAFKKMGDKWVPKAKGAKAAAKSLGESVFDDLHKMLGESLSERMSTVSSAVHEMSEYSSAGDKAGGWAREVFESSVIVESEGLCYQHAYSMENGKPVISTDRIQVRQAWVPVEA